MLILDRPQQVADWVGTQSDSRAPTVDAAIGFASGGRILAGVYFDCLTDGNVFAHIASVAQVIPPALFGAVATYVYRQLRLQRMTFAVAEDNTKTLALVRGLGAVHEATLAKAAGDIDLQLFVLWADAPIPKIFLNRGARHG